jgi:hypothetical protein
VKDGVVEAACAHNRWLRKTLLSALLGAIVEKRGTTGTGEEGRRKEFLQYEVSV